MSAGPVTDHYEVVIVGGGQAGLALGYFLVQQGRRFTILEAAEEPAPAWRKRWESLKLFTPARYDALPGLAFQGDPDRYPELGGIVGNHINRFVKPFGLAEEFVEVYRLH